MRYYEGNNDMRNRIISILLAAATAGILLLLPAGCSQNGGEQNGEKGSIEKMTDQAAETAVKKIRTPQDKARATQNLGDQRLEEMDKALQKQ